MVAFSKGAGKDVLYASSSIFSLGSWGKRKPKGVSVFYVSDHKCFKKLEDWLSGREIG